MDGVMPLSRMPDHVGILARSVEDVVHAFRALGDVAEKAPRADPRHVRRALEIRDSLESRRTPGSTLRFARHSRQRSRVLCATRASRCTRSTLVIIRSAARAARACCCCEAELLTTLAVPLAQRRADIPRDLLAMLEYAEGAGATRVAAALSVVVEAGRWVHRALLPFDALLMPTAAQAAFPMDAPIPPEQADFTAMANMSGGPAISVPMPVPADALPAGLQLTARRGEDWSLLDAALRVNAALR